MACQDVGETVEEEGYPGERESRVMLGGMVTLAYPDKIQFVVKMATQVKMDTKANQEWLDLREHLEILGFQA